MAYDKDLAARVRELIAPLTVFEERKMFGGLAFMVNTHMACGIAKDDLIVRVGKARLRSCVGARCTGDELHRPPGARNGDGARN